MKKKGRQPLSMSKGFAIILVLATLVLLAMLSLTYIKLALIDRNISRNYMDNKRAKLIAQSGVDYAIARIQEDIFDTSWQEAKTITINGKVETYTENAGSTYGQDRDIFKVTAKDCNSMINVNDELGNIRVTNNTKRILNALGDVVGIATLGDKIINNRPPQGYTSKQELLKVISKTEFETLKDLVTTHAWQDPNVANPVPLSKTVLPAYGDPYSTYDTDVGVYRYGRGKDRDGNIIGTVNGVDYSELRFADELSTYAAPNSWRHPIYGLDELNPQWIEIVSRSPVNINQAREEVLIALIKDLKGFFSSDRIRNAPQANNCYRIENQFLGFDYGPDDVSGAAFDELGFLYSTEAISATNAQEIAAEIKKCRDNDPAYSAKWFRGPFKTWRQFIAFIDEHLQVEGLAPKIIKDSRSGIFLEYTTFLSTTTGPSTIALNIAHQAKADALKANFNPNLHLNELNPDANLKTHVDKTDLIVNSTEFCFMPMGYFEIESEGFVLRPDGTDNILIANSKVSVLLKLYDCYRETNQKQFLQGEIPDTASRTNNGKTLEVGSEPSYILDAGEPIARQNEYSGYIGLPAVTGSNIDVPTNLPTSTPTSTSTTTTTPPVTSITTSPPTTTVQEDTPQKNWTTTITETTTTTTERSSSTITTNTLTTTTDTFTLGSCLNAHYRDNFSLDYRSGGATINRTLQNAPDRTEAVAGPYVYDSTYRLARSYRQGDARNPTNYAPADLRIDGAYVERHSSLAYPIDAYVFKDTGVFCYWVKPWFYPEQAGKPRSFLNICRGSVPAGMPYYPVGTQPYTVKNGRMYFANYYFPSQGPAGFGYEEPTALAYSTLYYRKNSSIFCIPAVVEEEGNDYHLIGYAQTTPCLNHNYHGDGKLDYLKSGQWLHIICRWELQANYGATSEPPQPAEIYINGRHLEYTANMPHHQTDYHLTPADILNQTQVLYIGPAGLSSQLADRWRNWSADSTIDEFYIIVPTATTTTITDTTTDTTTTTTITTTTITTTTVVTNNKGEIVSSDTTTSEPTSTTTPSTVMGIPKITNTSATTGNLSEPVNLARLMYEDSRYYRPAPGESYFISGDLKALFSSKKSPDPSIIEPPVGATASVADLNQRARIIGISWTYYGEAVDTQGNPLIKDYKIYPAEGLTARLKVSILKDGTSLPDASDLDQDGFSPITVEMDPGAQYKYKVTFTIENLDPLTAVLLYSPVFDDITIYYTNGVEFLSYSDFD